ncbi:uncharacterized protein cubi_00140 [Cryptosporidium ubiquitum]|uniref:Uncharacterized protein n=1 Tax=Cryptosporidium ubiquitum TaxID=857276 RepID=A0A1J4MMA1_9CRYT|nr:uncharacterized protein cubi_00140 [Cryptosporidium ubiquitum]OII74587.1 hypothetical protein cubi_00140 [Cryptosporidium ubiquitum]
MNSWIVPFIFLFLSIIAVSEAQIKFWSSKRKENNGRYKYLLDYFVEMSKFTSNVELVNLNSKLESTITFQKRIFYKEERVQHVCENSLLRLLKRNMADSKTFSSEMSVLRDSIHLWTKNFRFLQESDEVRTFKEFISFLDFINTKKFEIDFCIRLMNSLQNPQDNITDNKDSLKRKKNLCVELRQEIEDFISTKLSHHSFGVLKQHNKNFEVFKIAASSIHNELDQAINQVNKCSKLFNLILFLDENRRSLYRSKELEPYFTLKDFVDKDALKSIDRNILSSIIIELQDYLPENTIFPSSPLSKIVLMELNKANQRLKRLGKCHKYDHILVPLKKKLIYMMKSVASVLILYERSFEILREILMYVSYINIVYDKNMVGLCSNKLEKNKNKLDSLSLLNEILNDKEFDSKFLNKTKLYPTKITLFQYSKTKSRKGALLENRNTKGLPFFPDSRKVAILEEKFSDKPSITEIQKLIQHINLLSNELDHVYIYISNSTNIMLNSLEKLQFTNKVYSEIIESSTKDESVPNSLYSYSYLLSLDITMSLKKRLRQIKKEDFEKRKQTNNIMKSVDVKPELRNELEEASEEAINKVLNIISSLRQTVYERTQGSGLKNIKARLPTTKKKLRKEVLSPLTSIEDHLLNIKKSKIDANNKMINIEKQVKLIQNSNFQMESPDIISKLEKYIKPLNLIMKCSVVKVTSEEFESCKEVISQAPYLLKHIHSLIKEKNETILNQREIYNKTNAKLESLTKEWNRHLNWVRDIPKLCNDQLPTMNKLDSNTRMILG